MHYLGGARPPRSLGTRPKESTQIAHLRLGAPPPRLEDFDDIMAVCQVEVRTLGDMDDSFIILLDKTWMFG